MTDTTRPRSRRRIGWIIALAVLVALLVAAWFAGDAVARTAVRGVVQAKLAQALGIAEDHPMDVQVSGAMIPQLIAQRLDRVEVSSKNVRLSGITGDLSGTVSGMQFDGTAATITADLALGADQLRAMLPTDRVQIEGVTLAAPDVTVASSLQLFGTAMPLTLTLTPGAADGELELTAKAASLGGIQLTAEQVNSRFGGAADGVLKPWRICIADKIPAGVHLENVTVQGDRVVAATRVDGAIATDPDLQRTGSCG